MMSVKVLILCFVVFTMVTGTARAANPVVVMETSMGTIKIELFEEKAPITVKNFLKYAEDKHYDGTIFHRVMGKRVVDGKVVGKDFMIQGGGFEPGLKEKTPRAPIKNEASNGLSNLKYTLAMARLGRDVGDVKAADSATAQFFINIADNKFLDKSADSDGYAVFGRVIEGTDVVDKIKVVEVEDVGNHEAVPKKDVIIKSVKLVSEKK
jgi:cyclophilin family peptidyl-prolyl cis-trans isomerase